MTPLTHDVKETIRARIERDANFRQALLKEALETTACGDSATGNAPLRGYINATPASRPPKKDTRSKRTAV